MPFSSELGMHVYDPREALQSAAPAAAAGAAAFRQARELQLDERKMKALEADVAEKAKVTLHRQMGLSKMKADADEMIYNDIPQDVAMKTAFLNNSPDLFYGSDPAHLGNILNSEEANQIRDQFHQMTDQRIRDIKSLQDKHFSDDLDRKREKAESDALAKSKDQEINLMKITQGAADKEAQRDSERARETGRNERARADRMFKAQKDPDLVSINASLASAHTALQDKMANPKWHWLTDEKGLRSKIADLESQQEKRLSELGLSDTSSAAKPASKESPTDTAKQGSELRLGTVIEQGGKFYRYQGVDPKGQAIYVEVK